ncbi:MAG: hypothetical protein EAZ85_09755 [Bacteroidetes bacterium]|nr:MAG: hypothetical protein EAZ85_09755 [Bacteroidota bacterium]TAG88476.1 MAG: hypothetical protein EAZ20_08470 [Bacteroidota bacterium]
MQEQQSKLNVEIDNIEVDIFDIHSWYNKIEIKESDKEDDKTTKTQNDILILKLKYLLPFIQLQLKKTKKSESDKLKSVIADITEIIDYFELSNKLNKEGNKSSNIFFNYLKEKNIYIPYLESWIHPEEMKKWSNGKLYSEYIKSSENNFWSYAYKCISILKENNIKLRITIPNTIEEFKNDIENVTKNLKEKINTIAMIIPETIKPELKVQCSILILDIISFSDTEINSEQQMLTKFNNMITYFRGRINETLLGEKNITPDDMTILYVGDCLAIALKSQNHQEILFEFARDIFEQTDNNKYTCALHTGSTYWISFKNYEESPFKQLIHPTINDAFRLSSMGKSKEYIYITENYYNAIRTNNKFSDYSNRIEKIAIDTKNGKAVEILEEDSNGIFYQTIKTNKVKYIKFKRR